MSIFAGRIPDYVRTAITVNRAPAQNIWTAVTWDVVSNSNSNNIAGSVGSPDFQVNVLTGMIYLTMTILWSQATPGGRYLRAVVSNGPNAGLILAGAGITLPAGNQYLPYSLSFGANSINPSTPGAQFHLEWMQNDAVTGLVLANDPNFGNTRMGALMLQP